MDVLVTKIRNGASLPTYGTGRSAAFDLAVAETTVIQPGEIALVPTGLVFQLPAGHYMAILARSSTPLRRGLMVANGVGIVDEDYCGPSDEVKVQVINVSKQEVQLTRGERIAQGMILPIKQVTFLSGDLEELAEVESRGGFGSTGLGPTATTTSLPATEPDGTNRETQGATETT